MPKVTAKELADMTGWETKNLSVYVTRKKLVKDKNGLFDVDEPKNALFIAQNKAEGTKKPEKTPPKGKKEAAIRDLDDEVKKVKAITMQLEVNKLVMQEQSIRRNQIEIEKKEGQLIPTELIKALFLTHSKSITMTFKEGMEKIVDLFTIKYKLSQADAANMRKTMVEAINKGVDNAVSNTRGSLKKIITDYSEKRGVGDHD